jgi:hypothetical protein
MPRKERKGRKDPNVSLTRNGSTTNPEPETEKSATSFNPGQNPGGS